MDKLEKHAKNNFIILMVIMLFWIFMTFILQKILFPPSKNDLTTYEALKYYSHLKGYYGLDHITKGIAYIACVLIPLNFYFRLNNTKNHNEYNNIISTLFLLFYFLINGISLIIQGITAEFTINIISNSNIYSNHEFAVNLFRYVIQDGGISFSTYLVCNFCFIIWILYTNTLLKECKTTNKVALVILTGLKLILLALFIMSIYLVIYQIELAQSIFTFIDVINLVCLIIVYFNTYKMSKCIDNLV